MKTSLKVHYHASVLLIDGQKVYIVLRYVYACIYEEEDVYIYIHCPTTTTWYE